jgi:hypothetical protein
LFPHLYPIYPHFCQFTFFICHPCHPCTHHLLVTTNTQCKHDPTTVSLHYFFKMVHPSNLNLLQKISSNFVHRGGLALAINIHDFASPPEGSNVIRVSPTFFSTDTYATNAHFCQFTFPKFPTLHVANITQNPNPTFSFYHMIRYICTLIAHHNFFIHFYQQEMPCTGLQHRNCICLPDMSNVIYLSSFFLSP